MKMSLRPTVEVPLFLMVFSQALFSPVNTNLMLYRTCYILLGHDKTECSWLGHISNKTTKQLEQEVQPVNNMISLTGELTESVIAVMISILIGPWSDKFGRRPVFLFTTCATLASSIFQAFFSYFDDINPWFGLIGGIPGMLCGGIYSFVAVASSYISELSTEENRGIRIAIFSMSITLGRVIATFSSSFILDLTSYTGVGVIISVLGVISVLYTYFFIPESLKDIQKVNMIKGFFDTSNINDMYFTITKKRPNYNRVIIVLFTFVSAISTFIMAGEMSLMFLFLRQKFGWTLEKYTIFSGVQSSISVTGTIAGMYLFQNILHMRESVASSICFGTMVVGSLITGFATRDWQIYTVPIIKCLDGAVVPMSVTVISKIVDKDELGKVLAGTMGARFLCTLVSSPLYTVIYNATIDIDSAIYNFVSSIMYTAATILLIITIWHENRRKLVNTKPNITS